MPEYEFSLILIFSYGRFCPYTGKYGSEKARTSAYFTQWNTDDSLSQSIIFGPLFRSSRPEVFCKKRILKNFTKFTGKHLCQRLFFNKVAGLRAATLLKKRLWHRCFPVNFVKFLRTTFFIEHFRWLLLTLTGSCRVDDMFFETFHLLIVVSIRGASLLVLQGNFLCIILLLQAIYSVIIGNWFNELSSIYYTH